MKTGNSAGGVEGIVARLEELIAALDRRTPRPEREAESRIASDSAALRLRALERIGEIETCDQPVVQCLDARANP